MKGLLREWDDDHELVGISGTSGGAINALATWYGLVTADEQKTIELLDAIWEDLSASGFSNEIMNDFIVELSHLQTTGVPMLQVSPYDIPGPEAGKDEIRETLEQHIDFDEVPDLYGRNTPELVIGAVNMNTGTFETFTNEEVTPKTILASAAVPNMFEAVEINGHYYWDGLFSQNPPINDLISVAADRKPEELWIIQINPQESEGVPTSLVEIADRRNELAGNISLNQELNTIERVNEWIDEGHLPKSDFTKTVIRRIPMGKTYDSSTKVDRNPAFLEELIDLGEQRAAEFYDST